MASTASDGVLPELQRELDEFMATHASTITTAASRTSNLVEITSNGLLQASLTRMTWIATTLATSRLCETTQFLLSWLTAINSTGPAYKSASWLVAYVVGEILEAAQTFMVEDIRVEKMVEQVLDRCVVVFQEAYQSESARAVESSGGFFAFKPVVSHMRAPTPDDTLQLSIAMAWRRVAALVSLGSLCPLRIRLQKQLLVSLFQTKTSLTGKEYLMLKNLSDLRLGLDKTTFLWTTTAPQKIRDAALLLKTLQPLTLKPHKAPTRLATITAIASLLNRELAALDAATLVRVYSSFHGVTEWTTSISELHVAMLKLCGKREYTITAWELRIALLSISPNEIFSRYWKEDVHALLRVQYQQNKDGGGAGSQAAAVLDCVGRCFTYLLKRHFLNGRRIPGELDCMEIINTTQAWCFFAYPKHRSIDKLMTQVLPVLVQISIGIASYNMLYSIQSHIRRLLLEADHIFDEKKLVGLEAIFTICELCLRTQDDSTVNPSLPMDSKVLLANRATLGELIGQTLIEANALFGGELLIESTTAQAAGSGAAVRTANLPISAATKLLRDEYRRAIAIRAYACALQSLKHFYVALELSDDQKILFLVRSCIHNEETVRTSASVALHHIIQDVNHQAGPVFRGVTDYIFRLSNHLTTPHDFDAFLVLIQLITSLLQSILEPNPQETMSKIGPWESQKAKQESLLQIESVAVYLLVFEDARLLEAAIAALEMAARARTTAFGNRDDPNALITFTVQRPSVVDVLRKADLELGDLLFTFEPPELVESLTRKDLGFFRQLVTELANTSRASFRWSSSLAVIYAQLAIWNPEVVAFMWSDVNDKVTRLEPAMPSMLEPDSSSATFDLARWRNLAILATTTACPYLLFQTDSDLYDKPAADELKDSSVQSVISSSAVQGLFKRLCRFLKSPSLEQKKAAVLALGSTHLSSLPILTEVLHKYEPDAYSPIELPPSNSRHGSQGDITPVMGLASNGNANGIAPRRLTKEQKARNIKATAQLQLQWALGRCYRLLLHTTRRRPLLLDDTSREAVQRLCDVAINILNKSAEALRNLQQNHHSRGAGLDPRDAPSHIVFMMQQDFCSSIRNLELLMEAAQTSYNSVRRRPAALSVKTTRHLSSIQTSSIRRNIDSWKEGKTYTPMFDAMQREAWYTLLLSWCQSFSSLANARLSSNLCGSFFAFGSPARDHWMQRCDVLGEYVDDTLIPWQWMDEGDATRALGIQEAAMASFQRYFLCQSVFATLPVVAFGSIFFTSPISMDSTVFRWLDECFAVDVSPASEISRPVNEDSSHHFAVLQTFCHQVLGALFRSDFRSFVEVCVDKSFFSVSSGDKHNIAKQYFRAICSVTDDLKRLLQGSTHIGMVSPENEGNQDATSPPRTTTRHNLQVRVCHAILMHLGIDNDATQRQYAADLINELYSIDNALNDDPETSRFFRLNATISSGKRSNVVFGAQVTNRMQIAGASYLVRKLTPLCYQMSLLMLQFVSCCETMQQKKTLAVVLPWLAEVNLVVPQVGQENAVDSTLPTVFDADQLISLLFRITTNLGSTCSEQLEQAWLTLAFAAPGDSETDTQEKNLSRVLQFLFLQRTTSVRLATAKIVVWWLCRWQSAAHEVLREALLLVETRRRESAANQPQGSEIVASTIQPVDDIFVFVILMSDSCCHLAMIPSYLYQHPSLRETMMVQTVHFAFLALFALALDPTSFAVRRTVPSTSGSNLEDHQHQSLYADASNDCLVLLRNLLSHLCGPVELMAPIVEDLSTWSRSWESVADKHGVEDRNAKRQKSTRQVEQSMSAFASCLPPPLRNIWALECVKEITLALVPGSTLLQATSSRCNNTQVLYCVRFGLLGYRVLSPEFYGDVFLTLLDLLHHALDEHARDPSNAVAVIAETLQALCSMVASMPPQKLALYPQVLWVCVALLNHSKTETLSFQPRVVELLVEILKIPHFATNQLLQDVLLSKRPPQWSDEQASVLHTLVWTLDRMPVKSQRLLLVTIASFLVLPSPVFHANPIEHLVIITMTLMPFIIANVYQTQESNYHCSADENEENDDDYIATKDSAENSLQYVTDLRSAWLAVGSEPLGNVFGVIQNVWCHHEETPEDDNDVSSNRSLVAQFAAAFVPELVLLGGDESGPLVTMCFEILVKILAVEDIKKRSHKPLQGKSQDGVVTATLWLVESLMLELSRHNLTWRPTSALLGSLARLVRTRDQPQTWQAAVRIMSCLGQSNPSTSTVSVVRVPTISTTSSTENHPRAASPPPRIDTRTSSVHSMGSGAHTPSKKDGAARKFINFVSHRTSSASTNNASPGPNQTTHHTPTSPTSRSNIASKATDPADDRPIVQRDL